MKNLTTYFKVLDGSKLMSFGERSPRVFNYVSFDKEINSEDKSICRLKKQMHNSCTLEIERYGLNPSLIIDELKLTNQQILTWEDYWINTDSGELVDPMIKKINLQKNDLIHANFNLDRSALTLLNLNGNRNMSTIMINNAPKLEVLDLSECTSIETVNLGNNRNLRAISARNCNLSSIAQERLLRDFRPTITISSNTQFNMFRKSYETILDLRGNDIDWSNRKIASKIRVLLCNNWLVLWDNTPPASIVPPHMYSFFTNNLEESLIKRYYGRV